MIAIPESEVEPTSEQTQRSPRLVAIDALRGLVIVLMALDHSRDFFGDVRIRPEDVATTTTALFFTRWFTHFCAPTFVFLAGVSAWMFGQKCKSRSDLSRFLITRGMWLVFLEFTLIYFGLYFTFSMGAWVFLVISAIGVSMILLGLICRLPHRAVLLAGIVIVCGHNLLDPITAESLGSWSWLWTLLHQPGIHCTGKSHGGLSRLAVVRRDGNRLWNRSLPQRFFQSTTTVFNHAWDADGRRIYPAAPHQSLR